jgi:UDP-hydrolysing UDP-N-acetyl-D-glucosamine 2-epimerase
MRTIAVVTVARSDYGPLFPLLVALRDADDVRLELVVGGTHFAPGLGSTVDAIAADGFRVAARVTSYDGDDSPAGIARAAGRATLGFADAFAKLRPDVVLLLGDRYEMHAAAVAALPQRVPVAHVHGGELSAGAIDDALRHSLTKLSHLHFAATGEYARRILQLGEEPWRVTVSGAPGLDAVRLLAPLDVPDELGIDVDRPFVLVTFHPATLDGGTPALQVEEVLAALAAVRLPAVLTYPGADAGSGAVVDALERHAAAHADAVLAPSLGSRAYLGLMAHAAAMVGNSSSGIVEAATFALPVVNVGSRQDGRVRAANVVDVPPERDAIAAAIERVTGAAFRRTLDGLVNPYGDGHAAQRIVDRLRTVPLDDRLLVKRFHDLAVAT